MKGKKDKKDKDPTITLAVARAMYLFWIRVIQIDGMKGTDENFKYLNQSHRNVVRALKALSHNVVKK